MTPRINYILYQDFDCNDGAWQLGFNRFNSEGYIDDGHGWTEEDREEFHEEIILELQDFIETWESYEFSYAVTKLDGLREALEKLGLKGQEPAW